MDIYQKFKSWLSRINYTNLKGNIKKGVGAAFGGGGPAFLTYFATTPIAGVEVPSPWGPIPVGAATQLITTGGVGLCGARYGLKNPGKGTAVGSATLMIGAPIAYAQMPKEVKKTPKGEPLSDHITVEPDQDHFIAKGNITSGLEDAIQEKDNHFSKKTLDYNKGDRVMYNIDGKEGVLNLKIEKADGNTKTLTWNPIEKFDFLKAEKSGQLKDKEAVYVAPAKNGDINLTAFADQINDHFDIDAKSIEGFAYAPFGNEKEFRGVLKYVEDGASKKINLDNTSVAYILDLIDNGKADNSLSKSLVYSVGNIDMLLNEIKVPTGAVLVDYLADLTGEKPTELQNLNETVLVDKLTGYVNGLLDQINNIPIWTNENLTEGQKQVLTETINKAAENKFINASVRDNLLAKIGVDSYTTIADNLNDYITSHIESLGLDPQDGSTAEGQSNVLEKYISTAQSLGAINDSEADAFRARISNEPYVNITSDLEKEINSYITAIPGDPKDGSTEQGRAEVLKNAINTARTNNWIDDAVQADLLSRVDQKEDYTNITRDLNNNITTYISAIPGDPKDGSTAQGRAEALKNAVNTARTNNWIDNAVQADLLSRVDQGEIYTNITRDLNNNITTYLANNNLNLDGSTAFGERSILEKYITTAAFVGAITPAEANAFGARIGVDPYQNITKDLQDNLTAHIGDEKGASFTNGQTDMLTQYKQRLNSLASSLGVAVDTSKMQNLEQVIENYTALSNTAYHRSLGSEAAGITGKQALSYYSMPISSILTDVANYTKKTDLINKIIVQTQYDPGDRTTLEAMTMDQLYTEIGLDSIRDWANGVTGVSTKTWSDADCRGAIDTYYQVQISKAVSENVSAERNKILNTTSDALTGMTAQEYELRSGDMKKTGIGFEYDANGRRYVEFDPNKQADVVAFYKALGNASWLQNYTTDFELNHNTIRVYDTWDNDTESGGLVAVDAQNGHNVYRQTKTQTELNQIMTNRKGYWG